MNDADLEMMELEEVGNAIADAKQASVCSHELWVGPIGAAQHGYELPSKAKGLCPDCGRWWFTQNEWFEAREEVLSEWL